MTVGINLILAIVREKSRSRLVDIPNEFLQTDDERRLYSFIREHLSNHNKFPSIATIRRRFSARFEAKYPPEPAGYYREETERRTAYILLRGPYARLTEAMQGSNTDFALVNSIIDEMAAIKRRFNSGGGIEDSRTLIDRVSQEFEEALKYHGIRGVHTGYPEMDEVTGGWQPEDLVMIVGRPARGKSWLLLKQAFRAWQNGHKILWLSNEMGGLQSMRRLVGLYTGINPNLIRRGEIGTLSQDNFHRQLDDMREQTPFDMVTANFDRTTSQLEAYIEQFDPDAVYTDAAYLFKPEHRRQGSGSRRETIGDVVEELKRITADTKKPIIGTVQFNRAAEERRRGANARRREEVREATDDGVEPALQPFNPIAHLALDVIGETDIIGQSVSHAIGMDFAPDPFSREMRAFGFLKGREGEDGSWLCNYPQTQSDRINLDIVPPDDPRIEILRRPAARVARRPNNAPPANPNMLNFMRG